MDLQELKGIILNICDGDVTVLNDEGVNDGLYECLFDDYGYKPDEIARAIDELFEEVEK